MEAELQLMMESSTPDSGGKSSNIIVKGVKFIIKKIIELAKKIKNFIRNLFKPNNEKKVKDLHDRDRVINSAFSEYNITKNSVKGINRSISNGSVKSSSVGAKELSDRAANVGHNIKKGFIDNISNSEITDIIYGNDGNIFLTLKKYVLDIPKYIKTLENSIIPVLKSKFKNKLFVDQLKRDIGLNGTTIYITRPPVIINTKEFFIDANKLMDHVIDILNSPEVKEMSADSTIDPYFQNVLNGLMGVINTINMTLSTINDSIKFIYENPFNNYELSSIKDGKTLGEIIRHILLKSEWRNTIKGYNLVKPLIQSTAVAKGWTDNINDSKAGATRITVITNNNSDTLYKYAWNRKGIFDNKQDLKIKNVVSKHPPIAKLLALPTEESDNDGIYVVVPRANTKDINKSDIQNLESSLSHAIQQAGIRMSIFDLHGGNIGKINGKPVVIDYGNFVIA